MFYSSFSHHFFFQTVFVFIFPLPTPFYSSFSHHFFSQTVLVFIFLLPTPFLYFVLPSLLLSDTLCFHFPVTSLTDTFFILVSAITSSLRQSLFSFSLHQHLFILRSPITSSLRHSLFSFSRNFSHRDLFNSCFYHHVFSQIVFVFIFPSLISHTDTHPLFFVLQPRHVQLNFYFSSCYFISNSQFFLFDPYSD